ncbi:MAG: dihydrodipicolinate synthase family protein [Pseudomonadota bacterium]
MATLNLPTAARTFEPYTTGEPIVFDKAARPLPRVAFAAAHVVADPLAGNDPWVENAIDWDATMRFREHLWDLGLGVAEAMDTAQRGMGLGWSEAQTLIRHALEAAKGRPDALIACGAGTDHLPPGPDVTLDDVIRAYEEQIGFVEGLGGRVILMASRALAAAAKSPDDYIAVYDRILSQVKEPVIIHWLGEMFDPALAGYWGSDDHFEAMTTALSVIKCHEDKVDGVKVSLLSKEKEVAMRKELPNPSGKPPRMYTGDDFNYAELIAGDGTHYSDALLGIFDPIAPAAAAALSALGRGSDNEFFDILAPTVPLSRHIFKAPTRFYKTGVVFVAYLNGFQDHFTMIGGQQSARSLLHLTEIFKLADQARVLTDPDLAAARMNTVLAVHGLR